MEFSLDTYRFPKMFRWNSFLFVSFIEWTGAIIDPKKLAKCGKNLYKTLNKRTKFWWDLGIDFFRRDVLITRIIYSRFHKKENSFSSFIKFFYLFELKLCFDVEVKTKNKASGLLSHHCGLSCLSHLSTYYKCDAFNENIVKTDKVSLSFTKHFHSVPSFIFIWKTKQYVFIISIKTLQGIWKWKIWNIFIGDWILNILYSKHTILWLYRNSKGHKIRLLKWKKKNKIEHLCSYHLSKSHLLRIGRFSVGWILCFVIKNEARIFIDS